MEGKKGRQMGGTREEGMSGEFDQNNAKEIIFL